MLFTNVHVLLFITRYYVRRKKQICTDNKMKKNKAKTNKSERIEFRCTKGFKQQLQDLSEQKNMRLSEYIESICTDKIIANLMQNEAMQKDVEPPQKLPVFLDKKSEKKIDNNYDLEIWRLLTEGKTPTETAHWLNENGYKPQRSKEFTINNVHAIRQRLKRTKPN